VAKPEGFHSLLDEGYFMYYIIKTWTLHLKRKLKKKLFSALAYSR